MLFKRLAASLQILFILSLLVACSRENPLSEPEPYVEPEVVVCDEPADQYVFFDDMRLIDGNGESFDKEGLNSWSSFNNSFVYEVPGLADYVLFSPELSDDVSDFEFSILQVYLTPTSEPVNILLSQSDADGIKNAPRESDNPDTVIDPYILNVFIDGQWYDVSATHKEVTEEVDGETITDYVESIVVSSGSDVAYSAQRHVIGISELSLTINGEGRVLDQTTDPIMIDKGFNLIDLKVKASLNVPIELADCEVEDGEEFSVAEVNIDYIYTVYRLKDDEIFNYKPDQLNALEEGLFGTAVSHNSDWLAVGVLGDDTFGSDSGAVYVYQKGSQIFDTYLKASNSEEGDQFGYAVSLSGDYLAVSAPGEDSSSTGISGRQDDNLAENSGAVYIFKSDDNGVWSQQAYIKPPVNLPRDNGYDDGFGRSLVLKGDILLVGAPNEDGSNELGGGSIANSGAVYVYSRSVDDEWSFIGTIKAFNAGEGDLFGSSISLSDEGGLLVGAPGEDSLDNGIYSASEAGIGVNDDRVHSGAAYYYQRVNSSFSFRLYIKPSVSDAGDAFGSTVYINDDVMFVGAPKDDSNGEGLNRNINDNSLENSGAVFGFRYDVSDEDNPVWREYAYIKAPSPQINSQFGYSLAGDLNNLLVGAPFYRNVDVNNNNLSTLGRLYSLKLDETYDLSYGFELPDSNIGRDVDLAQELVDDQASARFGRAISVYGNSIAVGSDGFDETDSGTGATIIQAGRVDLFD